MPELPEVETVRRSLLPVVLNEPIQAVQVYYERILQHISPRSLKSSSSAIVLDLTRRGKYLIFQLENELELVAHLRMTGRLIYFPVQRLNLPSTPPPFSALSQGRAAL